MDAVEVLVLGMKKKGYSVFFGAQVEKWRKSIKSGATVIEEIIEKDMNNGYISRLRNFHDNEMIVHALN